MVRYDDLHQPAPVLFPAYCIVDNNDGVSPDIRCPAFNDLTVQQPVIHPGKYNRHRSVPLQVLGGHLDVLPSVISEGRSCFMKGDVITQTPELGKHGQVHTCHDFDII